MNRGARGRGSEASRIPRPRSPGREDAASWFAQQLDRYPVSDKDSEAEPHDPGPQRDRPDRVPVDETIDLHGCTLEEALTITEQFLSSCLARGLRKVVIIHGKGHNGEGVLRREVRAYLERHESTGAMGYAKGPDGGRGALWVMLRSGKR